MSDKKIKAMTANIFLEAADALETGQYGRKPVIGFAPEGSEHGQDNMEETMKITEMKGLKIVLIKGEDLHEKMEEMLDSGEINGAVAVHYPSPIGVSTVGKIVTSGKGKPMYIATTTDASNIDHISGVVRNAIYGIIATKADGVESPTINVANIDDARQTEKTLLKLAENGYNINFAGSVGADSGIVMRGNGLLGKTPDIMVMGSLTGNLVIKASSSYITDGNCESLGFDYGPGVGEGYDCLIMTVSRAPGAPVIAGTTEYTTDLIRHGWKKIADEGFEKTSKAGLKDIINELKSANKKDAGATAEEVKVPPKEVVTSQIPGIEIMDLGDAVKALWEAGIYAESGMGCTGLIVLMSNTNEDKAHEILKTTGYVS